MIMELLRHKDYIRVLLALEKKPLRFTDLQKGLRLNPLQINRALKFLRRGLWVIPHAGPAKGGRFGVQYRLGRRGTAFVHSFGAFSRDAQRRVAAIGSSEVAELQRLYH